MRISGCPVFQRISRQICCLSSPSHSSSTKGTVKYLGELRPYFNAPEEEKKQWESCEWSRGRGEDCRGLLSMANDHSQGGRNTSGCSLGSKKKEDNSCSPARATGISVV
ncbi:hypothetical protein CDAR_295021 [Caerostris darwini]|uniref:Uncharacterized protein n=1 Tax=Caerostris darwini TaxID=1538125 RepID=A0AAV4UKV5_9ARAC|nr:hypothetical protein CDAR_295021 [Caerostris darwini]